MHLWPSLKIKDSFREPFLKNVERVNSQKKKQQREKKQLSQAEADDENKLLVADGHGGLNFAAVALCRDLLLIFTCCFCFGAFSDEGEISYV